MEDQTRFGFRLIAPGWKAVMGMAAALTLMACGGPAWKTGHAVRPDERTAGRYCVLDREGTPGGRVINYVDPELCGRPERIRSKSSVRVPAEVALQQQVFAARRQVVAAQERTRELGERP